MPSAKTARASERKRIRNAPLRNRAKTFVTKARRLAAGDELDAAEQAARLAVVALDKAARKGVIHPNNAARRKSRLMKLLHKARGRQES